MTSPHFEIVSQRTAHGVKRVLLAGDFDMSAGSSLSGALVDAAHEPGVTRVIVDMGRTDFIDSHGIASLVAGYEAARRAGRRFTLANPRGLVRQVLDITGLAPVLIEDQETAMSDGNTDGVPSWRRRRPRASRCPGGSAGSGSVHHE